MIFSETIIQLKSTNFRRASGEAVHQSGRTLAPSLRHTKHGVAADNAAVLQFPESLQQHNETEHSFCTDKLTLHLRRILFAALGNDYDTHACIAHPGFKRHITFLSQGCQKSAQRLLLYLLPLT